MKNNPDERIKDDTKLPKAASSDQLNKISNETKPGNAQKENKVVEGFLCPICKCDLGRPDYLQVHFEREHMPMTDDQSSLSNSFDLRSMINRAKNKVLGRPLDDSISSGSFDIPISPVDDENPSLESKSDTLEKPDDSRHLKPLVLVSRSRTKMFTSLRDARSAYRESVNEQIISRLSRLVTIDVNAANKRRVLERHITPWADDRDITRCPSCAESFGLLKRKHHCRLCGFVICNQCSMFLNVAFAQEFIQTIRNGTLNFQEGGGHFKRADSMTSLNSITGTDGNKFIRLCSECRQLLNEKYECVRDKHVQNISLLPTFYRQLTCAVRTLHAIRSNAYESLETRSLTSGNSTDLIERQVSTELDKIHSTVKQIDCYLNSGEDKSSTQRKIAEALKSYGILAIHDTLTWRGQIKTQHNIRRSDGSSQFGGKKMDKAEIEPIIEQIEQVKKFLQNAKDGKRFDEVKALENNLRDLQEMIKEPSV